MILGFIFKYLLVGALVTGIAMVSVELTDPKANERLSEHGALSAFTAMIMLTALWPVTLLKMTGILK